MSTELANKIDRNNVRHMMVLSCAPLLAGLKIASLFVTRAINYEEVLSVLKGTEVEILTLSNNNGMLTLLLYNRSGLSQYLNKNMIASFLRKLDYENTDVDSVLKEFSFRYSLYLMDRMDFPHEMGIILGYPLEDVNGFMCNGGKNYLYSGYWKVYCRPQAAKKLFREYDIATERMIKELVE